MKKIIKRSGFTLVELLIVIALIAILSVAVLATINPIEQSNKARDAAFKNDAAEVLGAYERYYASQNNYPWDNYPAGIGDSKVLIGSTNVAFGVKNVGGSGGELITTSELKASFAGKKPFKDAPAPEDILWVYHDPDGNSNYVCYFPMATANRVGTKAEGLKCIDTGTNTLSDQSSGGCAIPTAWTYSVGASTANVQCVPEGSIDNSVDMVTE